MKKEIVILFVLSIFSLNGQETASEPEEVTINESEDSLTVTADSLIVADSTIDSAGVVKQTGKKNVTTAMILSTLIPGGGQFYNQSYIKGALVAGGEVTLGYFTVREHMRMLSAKDTNLADSVKKDIVDEIRFRRNTYAFFTGMVIAYAVADAYVDAHMFGFKKQQRLTIVPAVDRLGLAVRYRF